MEQFKEMVLNRHEYAKEWKARTGGKVLGYFETYFPEEIAYAAGVLPVRIMAEHEPDNLSDKYIYASCYPVSDMCNQILKGRYDYVDGLVNVEGCQWMFNVFEVAKNTNPNLFQHYLFLPDYVDGYTSKDVLRSELEIFQRKMEEWTGNKVTNESLDHAIEVYNTTRRLLRRISELRKADRPALFGSEAMNINLACQVMDKAELNTKLEKYIKEDLEERAKGEDRIRLILLGSETWDTRLEELVEELGANIVIDEMDNGTSYFWNEVIPQKDRLLAISLRYLERPHNPIKDNNWRRRPQHIFELIEDYHVDGALVAKQIYCHLHGTDNYAVWKMLRERNIPFHFFERDSTLPIEETEQRLTAFMNMMRPGLTRLSGWHKPLTI